MKIYIFAELTDKDKPGVRVRVSLVRAEKADKKGTSYRVQHPESGYCLWPVEEFNKHHRPLTRREEELIALSPAELLVMGISDNGPGPRCKHDVSVDFPCGECESELHS